MEENTKFPSGEEEEDLDALRLAALQSLKKKAQNNETSSPPFSTCLNDKVGHFSPRGKAKRGKFVRPQQGRIPRNNTYNGWARNSNLISVPMISDENDTTTASPKQENTDVPKLILPQDRYCKKPQVDDDKNDTSAGSKFDRYNNSDGSESDSDDDTTWKEKKPELKKSSSLDDLMAELENQIQGGDNNNDDKTNKQIKTKKKRKVSEGDVETKQETSVLKENLQPEPEIKPPVEPVPHRPQTKPAFPRKWTKTPRRMQNFAPNRHQQPLPVVQQPPFNVQPAFPPVYNGYGQAGGYLPAAPMMYDAPPPPQMPIPVYDRPLSPIAIKTDFCTNALGPLSPRSAAFVLQNRAIIEKRKRRSYSRSPSPRFSSKSPKRCSLSPKRSSKSPPSKRRSLSPSPVRKVLPPRNLPSRKQTSSIHDRLGTKSSKKTETNETTKPEKIEKSPPQPPKETIDPVLEARRKKFERKEINLKGGTVIRLNKPKEEQQQDEQNVIVKKESENEDILLNDNDETEELDESLLDCDDTIVLDHKIDPLFSDEESDSDNEGRFKTKHDSNNSSSDKIPILPFSQLVNGVNKTSTQKSKETKRKSDVSDRGGKNERRKRRRSRTPPPISTKKSSSSTKKNVESKLKPAIVFPNDKKIEIKIINRSKYEKGKQQTTKGGGAGSEEKNGNGRKVEMAKTHILDDDEGEVVETVAETAAQNSNEGDLRAQLSRKRAERQKHPAPEIVPTRLLQNALQSVGFRKTTKAKDESTVEGKLPIHLRLGSASSANGAAPNSDGFAGSKKTRKHKNKGSLEQV